VFQDKVTDINRIHIFGYVLISCEMNICIKLIKVWAILIRYDQSLICPTLSTCLGCAVAQVVSRWLHTVAARVRPCGIYGGQSGTGAGFFLVLQFPLPIIPPTAPHSLSSIIIWGE
jgi:hypothetical protein